MWGDGLQTRSFTFIDECVEGVLRYVAAYSQTIQTPNQTVACVQMGNNNQYDFIPTLSRLTKSDFREPVNIGSDEMVSMNEMAEIVLSFEDRKLPVHHIPGPEGVRGRNSDNTLIKEKLGWAPTMKLKASRYPARCCVYLCIDRGNSEVDRQAEPVPTWLCSDGTLEEAIS
jgi:GDP-D-mannose 3',5'-epimerase